MNEIFKINGASYYISKNVYQQNETPKRKTESYEIELYTTSGNTSVINQENHLQKSGNILVSKPGDLRHSIGNFECWYVHFLCNEPEIKEILNSIAGVFEICDYENVERIFKNLADSNKLKGTSKKMHMQGCMLELISAATNEKNKIYNGKYAKYLPDIKLATDFIKKNISNRITLSDISSSVHLSPTFFHSVFKDIKGTTPLDYLLNLRISKAKQLLKQSSLSLAEIALLCGFESQSYFCYVFKKKTNQTPKIYRNEKQIVI